MNGNDNNHYQALGVKVASGLLWSLGERILANGVSFVVSLILARLILPEEYGIIAVMTIFINISNVFVESGFGTALIQKKDADDVDFDTVFITQFCLSILLYLIVNLAAPTIAKFYDLPQLVRIFKVYGLVIVFGCIKNVQHAYVSKQMKFRLFFFSTLGGTLVSAIVGIILAYFGFGVWALVGQVLFNSIADSVVLFFSIKWKPRIRFSFNKFKQMYSFSWRLLVSTLLTTIYDNLYGLIIGKIYKPENLALYNKGNTFPTLIATNVIGPLQSATFPALAMAQEDKLRLKSMTRKTSAVTAYIMWPMLIGMACAARPMINVLITNKWEGCVIFLQITCIGAMLGPIDSPNAQIIKSVGRSDIMLKLDIVKKFIGLLVLFITIQYGVIAFACGRMLVVLMSSVLNILPNKKIMDYGIWEQLRDCWPEFICSAIMAIFVVVVGHFFANDITKLIIQIVVGVITYLSASLIIRPTGFQYAKETVISLLKKR